LWRQQEHREHRPAAQSGHNSWHLHRHHHRRLRIAHGNRHSRTHRAVRSQIACGILSCADRFTRITSGNSRSHHCLCNRLSKRETRPRGGFHDLAN
jgi:hypothetical protein